MDANLKYFGLAAAPALRIVLQITKSYIIRRTLVRIVYVFVRHFVFPVLRSTNHTRLLYLLAPIRKCKERLDVHVNHESVLIFTDRGVPGALPYQVPDTWYMTSSAI